MSESEDILHAPWAGLFPHPIHGLSTTEHPSKEAVFNAAKERLKAMKAPRFAPLELKSGWVVYDQLTQRIVNGVWLNDRGDVAYAVAVIYNEGRGPDDMHPFPEALGITTETYDKMAAIWAAR